MVIQVFKYQFPGYIFGFWGFSNWHEVFFGLIYQRWSLGNVTEVWTIQRIKKFSPYSDTIKVGTDFVIALTSDIIVLALAVYVDCDIF